MMKKRTAHLDIEVRYAETDQMGVVHHANYPVWFEMARTHLCRLTGYHYADIERLGYLLMVSGVQVTYRDAARYGETVRVTSRLDWLGTRALRFGYEVTRDGACVATGTTDHVWVSVETQRHCRIPDVLRHPFLALAGQEALSTKRPD
jgi:acyl-CoA thioester hydrolase